MADVKRADVAAAAEEPLLPPEPPPSESLPPGEWIRANLFGSVTSSIVTVVFGALLAYALYRAAVFVLWSARWELIRINLTNFMVGRFPRDELWRVWAALGLGGVMLGCAVGAGARTRAARSTPDAPAAAAQRATVVGESRRAWVVVAAVAGVLAFLVTLLPVVGEVRVVGAVLLGGVAGAALGRSLPRPARAWLPAAYAALLVAAAAFASPPLSDELVNTGGLFAGVELWREVLVVALAGLVAGGALASLRPVLPALVAVFVLVLLTRTLTPALLVVLVGAAIAAGLALGRALPPRARRFLPLAYVVGLAAAYAVLSLFGGVGTDVWGGLLLTVFVAVAGIVLSFPVGLLLALGRRSTFPAIRVVCVGYIELIRGVPLYTLLLMGAVVIGFFLPRGMTRPELVTRGIIVIVLFTSAYVAEIVRGGLQSVPKGQLEAAQAIGMPPVRTLRLVILPQALRAVIPALVGQFISLYKDTSLLVVLSLFEILGVATAITQQEGFLGQGLQAESLVFASFLYWVACYTMSRASQRLELRLGVGTR